MKNWYDALYKALTELGFWRVEADHGLFYKEENSELVILAIHVDDCLMTGGSVKLNMRVKVEINKKYKLTNLGPANWLLGIKINRNLAEHMVTLSQHAYIKSILTQYNFNDLKPSSTPMDSNMQLTISQSPTKLDDITQMQNIPYHEAVGSLMYAVEGEVDRAVVPPLPGLLSKGPLRLSIFGKMPFIDIPPL